MFKKSFKGKIILPIAIVLVVLVVALNVYMSARFLSYNESVINEKIVANINSLRFYLDESKHNSNAAAVSTALNIHAINVIKERDRNQIIQFFASMCDLYRISHYIITDKNGIVLARTHEPDNFGDSVLNQQSVKDAIDGKISTYFETTTFVKVAVHTGAPVYDTDGELIGVISAGVRLDSDSMVDHLKALLNSEITIFLGNTRVATTIVKDKRRATDTTLNYAIEKFVIEEQQEYSGYASVFGIKYNTFYKPLLNSENEVFAVIFVGTPVDKLQETSILLVTDGIVIGLIILVISIALLFFVVSSISKPLTQFANEMNSVAEGFLKVEINTKGDDEVGRLGKSLQKVVDTIQKLFKDINTMILEQKKGHSDYSLDTEAFHGDYKTLAAYIVELANFGMIDQLTEMPNRRSFDNRLEWEWKRAMREQTCISILLLDLDKFKDYNDAYGHQQGDIALQTIAKVLAHSIKRAIDFAARWGGEEFAVLLPGTDSHGALNVAEHIRALVENTAIPCTDEKAAKMTISIGINTQIPTLDDRADDFITKADKALYTAKATGRNKVCQ